MNWHCQSRIDQTTFVHDGLNVFSPSCRGTSALAGGVTRHVQPIASRDGITEWSQNVLQGRGRPERRGPGVGHLLAYAVPGGLLDLPNTPGSSGSRGEMAMVVVCCPRGGDFERAAGWCDGFRQVASFSASVVF